MKVGLLWVYLAMEFIELAVFEHLKNILRPFYDKNSICQGKGVPDLGPVDGLDWSQGGLRKSLEEKAGHNHCEHLLSDKIYKSIKFQIKSSRGR